MDSANSEPRAWVLSFCSALMNSKPETVLSFLGDDPVLSWGPYSFQGRQEIKRWILELREMFPVLFIKEKSMEVKGDQVKHEFLIESVTKDGQRAWLPCVGTYTLKNGTIQSLSIRLLHGWLAVKKEDLERVRPPP